MIRKVDLARVSALNFDLLTVRDQLCVSLSLCLRASCCGCNQKGDRAWVYCITAWTELRTSKQGIHHVKSAFYSQKLAHLLSTLADLH